MSVKRWEARWALLGTYVLLLAGLVAVVPALGSSDAGLDSSSSFDPHLATIELDGTTITAAGEITGTQTLGNAQGCILDQGSGALLGFGGGAKPVGLVDGSIGVKSKGNGQDCGQVEGSEELTIELGSAVRGAGLAAYRAELDIEVLQDAGVTATAVFVDGDGDEAAVGSFTLLTGAQIPSSAPPDVDQTPRSTSADPEAYCNPESSSGPNAADADNCYWTIESDSPFNRLVLTEDFDGKASLQGGDDWPASGPGGPTVFYLTDAPDGILDCRQTVGDTAGDRAGAITRLGVPGPDCTLKPYNFQIAADGDIEFEPDFVGETAFFSGTITKPVASTQPSGTVGSPDLSGVPFIDDDWILYDRDGAEISDRGGTVSDPFVPMQWCGGAPVVESVAGYEEPIVTGALLPTDPDLDGEAATWCVAKVEVKMPAVEASGSDIGAIAVFWVYGEDDPHWR